MSSTPRVAGLLGYDDALRVVQRLIDVSDARSVSFGEVVVLVGGTAMAAHSLRALSEDIDLWVASFSDEVVHDVEEELRRTLGPLVKIDVTATENVWGPILVRDIAKSPVIAALESRAGPVEVRALSIEDLFLLKLSAGRAKDLADLPLLLPRSTSERLVERFNQLIAWHGDRGAILGFADAFVTHVARHFGVAPAEVIDRLQLPGFMRDALRESHADGG